MAFVYRKRWNTPAEFEEWAKARYGDSFFDDDAPHVIFEYDDEEEDAASEPQADAATAARFKEDLTERQARHLMTVLIWSERHAKTVAAQITAEVFRAPAERVLAELALRHIRQHGVPPRIMMRDHLEERLPSGGDRDLCAALLDEHASQWPEIEKQQDIVAGHVERLCRLAHLEKAAGEINDAVERGDLEQAEAGLRDGHHKLLQASAATVLDAGEDAPIAPREWLLGTSFCRRFLSALVGPGGVGKTALRLVQAMAVATGQWLTGECVHQRSRVLYVTLEDSLDELRRRVRAARLHHNVDPEEVEGWLFLYTPPGDSKLAIGQKSGISPGRLESDLRMLITKRCIDLVIIDPFIKSYGGDIDENSNSAIDAVCGILTRLSIELNIAPDVLHHDAKGAREAGDSDRGRGASSFRDAGRLVRTVTVMSKDEATRFGIAEADRGRYIRYDDAKVNLAPAGAAMWFRLVGVPIGNGTADYPNGDTVQTVESWVPPQILDSVSREEINDILDEIDAGLNNGQRFSDANSARERAAWRVVEKHCPDLDEEECRKLIKDWMKSGLLKKKTYDDPETRKDAKGLFVDDTKRHHYAARQRPAAATSREWD